MSPKCYSNIPWEIPAHSALPGSLSSQFDIYTCLLTLPHLIFVLQVKALSSSSHWPGHNQGVFRGFVAEWEFLVFCCLFGVFCNPQRKKKTLKKCVTVPSNIFHSCFWWHNHPEWKQILSISTGPWQENIDSSVPLRWVLFAQNHFITFYTDRKSVV